MENKIEQLKHWLKDEQANALLRVSDYRKLNYTESLLMVQGEIVAFALVIEKVNEIFEDERSSVAEVKEKSCPYCNGKYGNFIDGNDIKRCKQCYRAT